MTSNCSHHRLPALDPAIDPAYADGPPPRPRRPRHAGEIDATWPVPWIPTPLQRLHSISIEELEDEIERCAEREER